jgi:hypothetical protein
VTTENPVLKIDAALQELRQVWCAEREAFPDAIQTDIGMDIQELETKVMQLMRACNPQGDWPLDEIIEEPHVCTSCAGTIGVDCRCEG